MNEYIYEQLIKINQQLPLDRVPGEGKAADLEGECLRAFERVVYRYYNDGDLYAMEDAPAWRGETEEEEVEWQAEADAYVLHYGDGFRTVSPSVHFLTDFAPIHEVRGAAQGVVLTSFHDTADERYDEALLKLGEAMLQMDWGKSTPNEIDCIEYKN